MLTVNLLLLFFVLSPRLKLFDPYVFVSLMMMMMMMMWDNILSVKFSRTARTASNMFDIFVHRTLVNYFMYYTPEKP
jgi:hypothetical protein